MNAGLTATELALLAHELRGALTVIVGLSDLLGSGLSPAEQVASLKGIDHAVLRADALIASALEGKAPVRKLATEPVDVADLTGQAVSDQRAVTGREVVLSARATPVVAGELHALERAIGNLIDNAVKYSPAGSVIEVSVSVEEVWAVIEVADRGPGIPEAHRSVVFEPFERLGRDDTEPGSGLGLSVVRSVAEAHGGSVSALPREDGGTIMRLVLPLAES